MFKDLLRVINIYPETISDGYGLRYAIYLAGCAHHCKGCHNPASWSPNVGDLLTKDWLDKIVEDICSNTLLDGITLTGGDPFYYPDSLRVLLRELKTRTGKNIWCWTGYTLEQIQANAKLLPCLKYIDTLVDGRFILEQRSLDLNFRGSSNQRIFHLGNEHQNRQNIAPIIQSIAEFSA
jgi:anaerobic ribonucleoside-triphosphate reductase activating protein